MLKADKEIFEEILEMRSLLLIQHTLEEVIGENSDR